MLAIQPDESFWIKNFGPMRGKKQWTSDDPPSDLVVEVDVTYSSLDRTGTYAALGVPEIWRYDGRQLRILQLTGSEYTERPKSLAFPRASSAELSQLVQQSMSLKRTEWLRTLRNWVSELR